MIFEPCNKGGCKSGVPIAKFLLGLLGSTRSKWIRTEIIRYPDTVAISQKKPFRSNLDDSFLRENLVAGLSHGLGIMVVVACNR